jgi:hypothetical protein
VHLNVSIDMVVKRPTSGDESGASDSENDVERDSETEAGYEEEPDFNDPYGFVDDVDDATLMPGTFSRESTLRSICTIRQIASYDKQRIDPICENCVALHNFFKYSLSNLLGRNPTAFEFTTTTPAL